jgi:sec-independent protein translocase protein TatA
MFEGLLQPMHLLLIGIVAMLFLGPKRLPELGKGLGEGIRGFRDGLSGGGEKKADPAEPQKKIEP